jgi:hypothetical protein
VEGCWERAVVAVACSESEHPFGCAERANQVVAYNKRESNQSGHDLLWHMHQTSPRLESGQRTSAGPAGQMATRQEPRPRGQAAKQQNIAAGHSGLTFPVDSSAQREQANRGHGSHSLLLLPLSFLPFCLCLLWPACRLCSPLRRRAENRRSTEQQQQQRQTGRPHAHRGGRRKRALLPAAATLGTKGGACTRARSVLSHPTGSDKAD